VQVRRDREVKGKRGIPVRARASVDGSLDWKERGVPFLCPSYT
jgi:hypothetical protein